MAQVVEVYPKLGCVVDNDPLGFAWTVAARNAVKARIQGIADGFSGVTIEGWHLHPDEGFIEQQTDNDGNPTGFYTIQTPKAVVILTMPNNATHANIVEGFVADDFWPWAKQGVRNLLPSGVTVVRWWGKLMTSLGRIQIDEAGS